MSRRLLWFLLSIAAALALAVVLIPALVIQPFRPQSPRGLEISFFLKRLAPIFTIVALIACLAFVVKLWRGARWSRIALILLLVPAMLSAWFARQMPCEWMFNPLANAGYVTTPSGATFIGDSDLVLALARNGEAAAYPTMIGNYHQRTPD